MRRRMFDEVTRGYDEGVDWLLEREACDVNAHDFDDRSALMNAAAEGHTVRIWGHFRRIVEWVFILEFL